MPEWIVKLDHSALLGDLWGALNDPNPDPPPDRSYIIKVDVGRFSSFKVEIFAKEHPPPHFRVRTQAKRQRIGSLTVSNCRAA